MTIVQMLYFKEVCETLSFTKAAARLNISQPAVSGAIKAIEEECGVSLFSRKLNALSLTDEGHILLEEVRLVLQQYSQLEHVVKDLSLKRDFIRVGLSTFSGNEVFPELLAAFKQEHPSVTVVSTEETTANQIKLLDDGKVDVIITRGGAIDALMSQGADIYGKIPLRIGRLLFCLHKDSPYHKALDGKEPLSPHDLKDIPMAMLSEEFGITRSLRRTFTKEGIECNIVYTTSQMYSIERFIEKNIAGGFLPEATIAYNPLIRGYAVSFIQTGHTSVFWRKDRHMFQSVKSFLDIARRFAKKNAPPK